MARLKSYTVYAKVTVECGINIKAESLEDAVEKANELKETDFVEIFDNYMDGNLKITGVHGVD